MKSAIPARLGTLSGRWQAEPEQTKNPQNSRISWISRQMLI